MKTCLWSGFTRYLTLWDNSWIRARFEKRSFQRKCAGAQNAKRCCHFFFMKDQCDVPRFPADICCCVRWNCGSFAPFASGMYVCQFGAVEWSRNCAQGDHRTPADSHWRHIQWEQYLGKYVMKSVTELPYCHLCIWGIYHGTDLWRRTIHIGENHPHLPAGHKIDG